MAKFPKGNVVVESFRGRVRLRWRYRGERLSMTIGDANEKGTWTAAEWTAELIHRDLKASNYDETQAKYRTNQDKADKVFVTALFESFQLARGMSQDSKYKALLGKLKSSGIGRKDAERISQADAEEFFTKMGGAASTQRSYLHILRACWEYGRAKKGLKQNPWNTVELPKAEAKQADPFNHQEVEKILKAFEGSFYLNWVKALFSLGCRPGELSALTWGCVDLEQRRVCFNKAWSSQKRTLKSTKNNKIRFTPITHSFAQLLESIKPEDAELMDLVFPSPEGVCIDIHNFLNRHWKPTLKKLGIRYRSQYNTRHTVWSHAIAGTEGTSAMPIAEAAKYAGNRPETMIRHYLGSVTQSEMPDLIAGISKS